MKKLIILGCTCILLTGCQMAPSGRSIPTVERLRRVVIPEVEFSNTPLSEAIYFISNEQFPIGEPPTHAMQKIVEYPTRIRVTYLIPIPPNRKVGLQPPFSGFPEMKFERLGPNVTFHAEQISVYDLLTEVVRQSKATLVFTDGFAQIELELLRKEPKDLSAEPGAVLPLPRAPQSGHSEGSY